jgi:hypothetical protein
VVTTDPSTSRDARLRLVRRLRIGVVSAGVVGSLGLAGVVASGASADPETRNRPDNASGTARDDSFAQRDDDSGQTSEDPWGQPAQPPDLQRGFGQSHGSTGGS